MSTDGAEGVAWPGPKTTTFVGLLLRSVVLGMLIAVATSVLYSLCLSIFGLLHYLEMPTLGTFRGFTFLDLVGVVVLGVIVALLGAVSGVFVAALFWIFLRLRLLKGLAGAAAGLVVGLPVSIMFFRLSIGLGQVSAYYDPSPVEEAAELAFALILPIVMGTAHGWLLARWTYGQDTREQRVRFSLITLGIIAAFFLVVSIALGTAAGLDERQRVQTLREEAAITPEVAQDVCAKLALSPQDSRCREGATVWAHDFFPEIRGLADKEMTYEQIEALFGAYKRSCGVTMHKTPGDEGYFVCLYDLKGNKKYWFTFAFTTSGRMMRVSTSSAPPPP